MNIAVDFDGTIVEHEFPDIGPPVAGAFMWMKAFQEAGAKLILSTSPKAYAHLYIDDAAFGCPLRENPRMGGRPFVNWDQVGPAVMELMAGRDTLHKRTA